MQREAGVDARHLWRTSKAIFGLADGPSAFHHSLGDFLRKDEVWEAQAGFAFDETTLDLRVY